MTHPGTQAGSTAQPPVLTIVCADKSPYTAQPGAAPITIGRGPSAHIRIDDERISGLHLLISVAATAWSATDNRSTNGTFHSGQPIERIDITEGLTILLGNPDEGIPVTFALTTAPGVTGIGRAGAAVTVRREELGYTKRHLAAESGLDVITIEQLEHGEAWPEEGDRTRLEQALQWPEGTLEVIRDGGADPVDTDTSTEALSHTVRTELLIDALDTEANRLRARIAELPGLGSPTFLEDTAGLLVELRQLIAEAVAAQGASESRILLALSDLRRTYTALITYAATAPNAPLAYRLYRARHRGELTREEIAVVAAITPEAVSDAESGAPIPTPAVAALEALIAAFTDR